jgi:hypothetical protein
MVNRKKRETLGKVATRLAQKQPDERSVIELTNEMLKEYEPNLIKCVLDNRDKFDTDFFIRVETKMEPLLNNVFKFQFFPLNACPTPTFDQTIYIYNKDKEEIRHLWTVPCQDACIYLMRNARQVAKAEQESLMYVQQFYSGELLRIAKLLNGEPEQPKIITEFLA